MMRPRTLAFVALALTASRVFSVEAVEGAGFD
jgi:hypothetical protein